MNLMLFFYMMQFLFYNSFHFYRYDGWGCYLFFIRRRVEKKRWRLIWFSKNEDIKSILLDDEKCATISYLLDRVSERLHIDKEVTDLKLSYKCPMSEKIAPKFILDDIDVKCYLFDRRGMSQCKMMLHVELITKDQDKC